MEVDPDLGAHAQRIYWQENMDINMEFGMHQVGVLRSQSITADGKDPVTD